eukprot:8209206-Pyramimonas_sp.AAC.1
MPALIARIPLANAPSMHLRARPPGPRHSLGLDADITTLLSHSTTGEFDSFSPKIFADATNAPEPRAVR